MFCLCFFCANTFIAVRKAPGLSLAFRSAEKSTPGLSNHPRLLTDTSIPARQPVCQTSQYRLCFFLWHARTRPAYFFYLVAIGLPNHRSGSTWDGKHAPTRVLPRNILDLLGWEKERGPKVEHKATSYNAPECVTFLILPSSRDLRMRFSYRTHYILCFDLAPGMR